MNSRAASATALLAELKRKGSRKNVKGMARYGIVARKAFGVSVGTVRSIAKRVGRDHELAAQLWKSGWFEARLLAVFIEDPRLVTSRQMDAWARDFENWADCDTACFHLFDKTEHAWNKIARWSTRRDEFVKRAAFALLASIALHDKHGADAPFVQSLKLIHLGAADERNFVKKGVSWALRGIGHRNPRLKTKAIIVAQRLAGSDVPSRRWVGKDALRDLLRH
jgi:3-methyladenine DNA glycosylase AlkD